MTVGTDLDRALDLFGEFVDLTPSARAQRLRALAQADPVAAHEVRELFRFHETQDAFLDPALLRSAFQGIADRPLTEGMRFAGCTVLGQIGAGGSSVVYLAEQDRPRRRVAIKLLTAARSDAELRSRLEREADLIGRLGHPHIAQIYQAGVDDVGDGDRAYLVLEYVDGSPIDAFARQLADDRARVRLVATVCDAIRHAHSAGVVHLDLKPANILVRGDGTVKVLDFGVGRTLDAGDPMAPLGLTLGYAAPEQVHPQSLPDVRTDVYALGVLLFELLSSQRPLHLDALALPEAIRAIGATPRRPLLEVRPDLDADLASVVDRCLRLRPADRYHSVSELAGDLQRWLADLPVSSRQDTAFQAARRALRRGRRIVATVLAVTAGLLVATIFALRAADRNHDLSLAERRARSEADAMRSLAEQESAGLRSALYVGAIGHADAALAVGDGARARQILEQCAPERRGWEWHWLHRGADRSLAVANPLPSGGIALALSPDRARLLALHLTGRMALLDATTLREIRSLTLPDLALHAAFAPSGDRVYIARPHARLLVLNAASLDPVDTLDWTGSGPLALDPKGHRLAFASAQPTEANGQAIGNPIHLAIIGLAASQGPVVEVHLPSTPTCLAWHPSGEGLIAGLTDGSVALIHALTGTTRLLTASAPEAVRAIALSERGDRLAAVANDRSLRTWLYPSGEPELFERPLPNKLSAVAWSNRDHELVVAGTDTALARIDAHTGTTLQLLPGHADTVVALHALPGSRVASAARDGTVRLWDATGATDHGREARVDDLPDDTVVLGETAIVLLRNGQARCIPLSADAPPTSNQLSQGRFAGLVRLDADSALLADAQGHLFITRSDGSFRHLGATGLQAVTAVGIDRSRRVLLGDRDGHVHRLRSPLGDALDPTLHDRVGTLAAEITALATLGDFAFAGSMSGELARIEPDGSLRVTSVGTIPLWCILPDHDRGRLIISSDDGMLRWLDPQSLAILDQADANRGPIYALALSADRSRLFVGGWDNNVRVIDPATRQTLLIMRAHRYAVISLDVGANGRLVTASNGREVRVW